VHYLNKQAGHGGEDWLLLIRRLYLLCFSIINALLDSPSPLSHFLSLPHPTLFLSLARRRRSCTLERVLETLQWRTIIPSTRRRGVKAGRSDRQGGVGSGRRPLHLVMNFKLARIHNAAPLTVGMNRRWQSKTAGLIFPGACAANYLPTTATTMRMTTTIVDKVEYRAWIEARDKATGEIVSIHNAIYRIWSAE